MTQYTPHKVRELRSKRKNIKSKIKGMSDTTYQLRLGDLIGAGHLSLKNIVSNKSDVQIDSFGNVITTKTIEFRTIKDAGSDGEQPHFGGYLSSGHPSDPHFTLKGWFNEDGQIRIELVK